MLADFADVAVIAKKQAIAHNIDLSKLPAMMDITLETITDNVIANNQNRTY